MKDKLFCEGGGVRKWRGKDLLTSDMSIDEKIADIAAENPVSTNVAVVYNRL